MRKPDTRDIDIHQDNLEQQRQAIIQEVSQLSVNSVELEQWIWIKDNFKEIQALRKLLRNG